MSEGAADVVPLHRRPTAIALVAIGGTVGTGLRLLITRVGSRALATPYVTMIINLVGAFLLGLLLERLARVSEGEGPGEGPGGGPGADRRQRLRLLLGVGALGGFTTYSSFAVDVATFGGRGQLGAAAAVALGTVLLGLLATAGGLWCGARGRKGASS